MAQCEPLFFFLKPYRELGAPSFRFLKGREATNPQSEPLISHLNSIEQVRPDSRTHINHVRMIIAQQKRLPIHT